MVYPTSLDRYDGPKLTREINLMNVVNVEFTDFFKNQIVIWEES